MVDVDGSRSFDATADAVWDVVADPARLSDWVPTMRHTAPAGPAEVHLEGDSHGHHYDLTSTLDIDQSGRQLHWGAPAGDGYRGWLRVEDRSPGAQVHLHIAVPDERVGTSPDAATEIRRGMEEAFDRLAGLIGS